MIRPHYHQRFLKGCLSVARRSYAVKKAHRFRLANPRSYHATACEKASSRTSWADLIAAKIGNDETFEKPSWSEEWKRLGLGADLVEDNGSSNANDDDDKYFPKHLFFVQLGFGVDQHIRWGDKGTEMKLVDIHTYVDMLVIEFCSNEETNSQASMVQTRQT